MIKFLAKLIFFMFSSILISCDSNENSPFNQNHHRLEFDIVTSTEIKKRIGVANLVVNDQDNLEEIKLVFNLIHKGEITILSPECEISIQKKFDSKFELKLENIIKNKKNCNLLVLAESRNASIKDFAIYESAIINIVHRDPKLENMFISLTNKETSKNYHFTDEGAIQLRSSFENSDTIINVISEINEGYYEISGCSKILTDQFENKNFNFILQKFFKTKKILKSDSCLITIKIFDKNKNLISKGFLFVSIFDSKTVLTKKLNFNVINNKIKVYGNSFEVICSINDSYLLYQCPNLGINCEDSYDPEKIYWIRGITPLGRKNVFAIKDEKIIWEE